MGETETVTGTVARQVPLEPVLATMRPEFGKLLPAHLGAERYERWCVTFLRGALASKQADQWQRILTSPVGQMSVMQAFLRCGTLGLEPGVTFHLVPFGGEVTGITDYKGEIQLITNAERCSVVAQLVRAEDDFRMIAANLPPKHDAAEWFADRGPVVGGYAYVAYERERCSVVITMSEAEFLQHRGKAKTTGIWDEWPDDMRTKTLIHKLRKYVPWSAERLWTP